MAIQQRTVGVFDGVMRLELVDFEYQHSKTGVKYAEPEGHLSEDISTRRCAQNKHLISGGYFLVRRHVQ